MRFSIYAILASATLSITAPASYSVEVDIVDFPNIANGQNALQDHPFPQTLDNPSTLPYSFVLQDPNSGQFLSPPAIATFAPGQLGGPFKFTLQNGVLSPASPDADGNTYQFGISPLLVWPPRTALLPLSQGPAPGTPLQFVAASGNNGLQLQFAQQSQQYGTLIALGSASGAPVVVTDPGQGKPLVLNILRSN